MKITKAKFIKSDTKADNPLSLNPSFAEIAFIGRSNVGKSSLINALCGQKNLALTSATPGKTKLINYFEINEKWYLVDLPGYGYAKLPPKEKAKLEAVIRHYLNFSPGLKHLFVLVDSRHDLTKADEDFLREVSGSTIPFSVIFTKGDKLGPNALKAQCEKILGQIKEKLDIEPKAIASSSETRLGKDEILNHIDEILKN